MLLGSDTSSCIKALIWKQTAHQHLYQIVVSPAYTHRVQQINTAAILLTSVSSRGNKNIPFQGCGFYCHWISERCITYQTVPTEEGHATVLQH